MSDQADGFALTMPDGTTARVIPDGRRTELLVGSAVITILQTKSAVRVTTSSTLEGTALELPIAGIRKAKIKRPTRLLKGQIEDADGGRGFCGICRGVRFCVKNGCFNIGCGWICHHEP